jgi:hypothetical protein
MPPQRFVAGTRDPRVRPDDPVRDSRELRHLLCQVRRIAGLPAVRDDPHHGTARDAAIEFGERSHALATVDISASRRGPDR